MNLKIIGDYINTLKPKYKSIQKTNSCLFPLRIIGQELTHKNKDIIYIMQTVGKKLVSKVHATELFKDKRLLNSLSPYDL